jgi:hypothetical protein
VCIPILSAPYAQAGSCDDSSNSNNNLRPGTGTARGLISLFAAEHCLLSHPHVRASQKVPCCPPGQACAAGGPQAPAGKEVQEALKHQPATPACLPSYLPAAAGGPTRRCGTGTLGGRSRRLHAAGRVWVACAFERSATVVVGVAVPPSHLDIHIVETPLLCKNWTGWKAMRC